MPKTTSWVLTPLLPLLLLACATVPQTPGVRDRTRVTGEELMATHATTLYDAIQQIRPEFLRSRGISSIQNPQAGVPRVFVDNVEMGDIQFLKTLNPGDVAEVQRLSAEQATTRWGTGFVGGALLVFTHAGAAHTQP